MRQARAELDQRPRQAIGDLRDKQGHPENRQQDDGDPAAIFVGLNCPSTADGSQPVVLQALVEDASGGSATTATLTVPVAANGAPTGIVAIAAGAPVQLEPNKSTTIAVHAEDTDGLAKIDLHVAGSPGAITQPDQTKTLTGNPTSADTTFTITATQPSRPPRTLKYGDTFVVLDSRGDIGKSAEGAGGLFHDDTRHLSCLELLVNNRQPLLLGSTLRDDNSAFIVDLTNPDIMDGQHIMLEKDRVVTLVEPCEDNWCHVQGEAVPGGIGFVYSGPDYHSLEY